MRSLSISAAWGIGALSLLGWGRPAQAQPYSPRAAGIYPASYSRYYYYSPYDSGYYTVFSPGYRATYHVPGASDYYQPKLPRYYPTPELERSPGSPSYAPPLSGGIYTPSPSVPASPGSENIFSPGSSSYSSPGYLPEESPGPPPASPPTTSQGDYPSSADYYIPDVRRNGSPGPYYYYKADLNRFYYNPRAYEVNKLDIDRQYFNHRSPHFFSPAYWSYYQIPGTSTFYKRSAATGELNR